MNRFRQSITTLLLVFFVSLNLAGPVAFAASKAPSSSTKSGSDSATAKATNQNITSGVTQSYSADTSVQIGMIVELKVKQPDTVVPLPSSDMTAMLGVVIPQSNATIVLTPKQVTQQQVLVATSGHFSVLVSNQAGPIKVGDYITISAISGIGMKAGEGQLEVVGRATGSFTGSSNVIGQVKLKDTVGRESTVSIGRIPVDITVSHNPLFQKTVDYVPGFLAKIAVTVASHPVSVARIYLSCAVLVITAVIVGNMLYSGIKSGMIAVGRNPLSKKSIIRSLIQTVVAGLIIFVAGVFAVYLLLKL